MTKLANLIEALTELDGREVSTLSAIACEIAEAGYVLPGSAAEDSIGWSAPLICLSRQARPTCQKDRR
jgi:hypothetical protein